MILPLTLGALSNGQCNLLVIALILIAFSAAAQQRWNVSASCLSLACMLKVYPISSGLLLALIYPRKFGPRFLVALAIGVAAPFLFQRFDYVCRQYQRWFHYMTIEDRSSWSVIDTNLDFQLLCRMWWPDKLGDLSDRGGRGRNCFRGHSLADKTGRPFRFANGDCLVGIFMRVDDRIWSRDRVAYLRSARSMHRMARSDFSATNDGEIGRYIAAVKLRAVVHWRRPIRQARSRSLPHVRLSRPRPTTPRRSTFPWRLACRRMLATKRTALGDFDRRRTEPRNRRITCPKSGIQITVRAHVHNLMRRVL